jgi:hypothetical protein
LQRPVSDMTAVSALLIKADSDCSLLFSQPTAKKYLWYKMFRRNVNVGFCH